MTDAAHHEDDAAAEPEGDTMQAEGSAAVPDEAGDRVAQRIRRVLDHGAGGEG